MTNLSINQSPSWKKNQTICILFIVIQPFWFTKNQTSSWTYVKNSTSRMSDSFWRLINYYELTRKHMSHVKKNGRFYIANKKVRLETLLLWTPFICEGTYIYVFFPARLLTNVIIPVNLCSSAQLFPSILLKERGESESVTLIFSCYRLFCHVIDYLSPFWCYQWFILW